MNPPPAETVLVTGATSLIGQHLVRRLLARGTRVVGFQRRSATALVELAPENYREILGTLTDAVAVDAAVAGCDAVVHLAAKVGIVGTDEEFRSVNVDGTCNLLAACERHRVSRVVHVSSPSVAHTGTAIVGGLATPAVVGRANALYAETKAEAEIVALSRASSKLGVVAIRPHLVWGPGDTQLVGRIIERAQAGQLALVNGGRALVDTTYIDNAVDALTAALDTIAPGARSSGRAYLVSNAEPRPIRDLVLGICRAAGIENVEPWSIPLWVAGPGGALVERVWQRDDEPPLTRFLAEQLGTAHWFDPRPARDDLGYWPAVSIDTGIERLAEWFHTSPAAVDQNRSSRATKRSGSTRCG